MEIADWAIGLCESAAPDERQESSYFAQRLMDDVLPTNEHSGIAFPSKCLISTYVETMCRDLLDKYFSLDLKSGVFR